MPRSRATKRVRGDVPNMVNGISQQAPSLRLSSQSEDDDNTYPLIVDGLTHRPPTRHLTKLQDTGADLGADDFFHLILRDATEKYVVNIDNSGNVAVWDFAGTQKTVTDNSNGYLSGITSAKDDLRALTVADHTFIINRKKTVAADTATEPARPYEGIVNIKAASYGKSFRIYINGSEVADYQVPTGSSSSHTTLATTENIANELYNDLVINGYNTAPWSVAKYQNTVYIKNTSTDFDLDATDTYANSLAIAVKDEVVNFSDLPLHNADGFTVKVKNNNADAADDYWVKFSWSDTTGSQGTYSECVRPGSDLGVDEDTMPHLLVREAGGSFTFKPATWDQRKCGDAGVETDPADDTVPNPTFVGQTIDDVFFHNNRLGLLTAENAVMSESRKFFNFFRQTLTAVLDTDPIDVAASHIKVSFLHHAVPFQSDLILFSDRTQFRLDKGGNANLTPTTVGADALTEMEVSDMVRPVVASGSMYFISESESWAQLFEFFVDKNSQTAEPVSVSSHCPQLIPAGCEHMVCSPHLGNILIYSNMAASRLYMYQYYVSNREKLQSSWVRWNFPNVTRIGTMDYDQTWLTMVVRRDDGTYYLERINMEAGQAEKVNLDRRTELTGGSYDSGTDQTTFTAPYTLPSSYALVTKGDGVKPLGVELTPVTPGTLVVTGDLSGDTVYLGQEYTATHEMSELFYRSVGNNSRIAVIDGRLQVYALAFYFAKSSYFKIEVTPEGRATRTYEYAGWLLGDSNLITDQLVVDSGRFSVPILSRSDRVSIKVINDTWRPFALTTAAWRGVFNPSNRQM
ncbi:MAG: phage nozzle protein [bacterium]